MTSKDCDSLCFTEGRGIVHLLMDGEHSNGSFKFFGIILEMDKLLWMEEMRQYTIGKSEFVQELKWQIIDHYLVREIFLCPPFVQHV